MTYKIFEINAFAENDFSGNPAAICVLESWLSDSTLQSIAIQNALPATVFLVKHHDGFQVRWFAPEYEIDLCGHGSLAAAHVIFHYLEPGWSEANLYHPSSTLKIKRSDPLLTLDFPAKLVEPIQSDTLAHGLGAQPAEIYQYKHERCLAIFKSEESIYSLKPNMSILKNLPHRGVIVSATSSKYDFISRTFYPRKYASEDAVTGSSHCLLVPYWADKLNKTTFQAYQASHRGGKIKCELNNDRVLLHGQARVYLQGDLFLDL